MFAWLMLAALAIEAATGWPDWLDRRIGHPVRWFGWLVAKLEKAGNRTSLPRLVRIVLGGVATLASVALVAVIAWAVAQMAPAEPVGFAISAVMASTLVATRSLHDHVAAVNYAFSANDLAPAREALSRIVGRETATLDEAAVARAAIESLAENTSDGVIAPIFWGVVLGLPGLFAYKAVNTLDSMIGHRSERYEAFGKVAARLDDLANLIPARLTGFLFGLCAWSARAVAVMLRDARSHRSPNAGWPESAMAGALGVRLSGPRSYGAEKSDEPWLNAQGRNVAMADLSRALSLYRLTMVVTALILAGIGLAS
ncbi:adenosylcobinamide-phosphate synthase CbiB [Croceicoccus sp. F390]|uniref:Cobalamin biosynthesis protein CobD n=1 Tax=Croceicoccus esteveae TaxID=3075597 RepID=A0ABU2ZKI0_9SPHN|nr:adenosylcobinamide-phosphate synthase CbiB [Croceicoccus sp. F390]MDT0577103.1 adenosylcobinamide-phosphate synthase CbiB [Croceicoccus sp. F390]